MVGESLSNPEENEATALRADIERLFTPENCKALDSPYPRDIFLNKKTFRRLYPLNIPDIATEIALEGYAIKYGVPRLTLYRGQYINSRFFRQTVAPDFVHCSLTDYEWSGGNNTATPYAYNTDMLQPTIPYDERFARIVKTCIEHAGEQT